MVGIENIKKYLCFYLSKNVEIYLCEYYIDPGNFEGRYLIAYIGTNVNGIEVITIIEEDIFDWIQKQRNDKINNIINK